MAIRKNRVERRGMVRRLEKRQEERFVEKLEKARDDLDTLIADVERGRADDLMDAMNSVDDAFGRAYRQAERMEGRDDS